MFVVDSDVSALPGVAKTIIVGLVETLEAKLMWSAEDGALTQVYLAAAPEVVSENIRGQYLHPIARIVSTLPLALDEGVQDDLWTLSEKILAEKGF